MDPVGLVTFSSVVLPILEGRGVRLSPESEELVCSILRGELESECVKNETIVRMIPKFATRPALRGIKSKASEELAAVRFILSAMETGQAILNPSQVTILTETVERLADKHFARAPSKVQSEDPWSFRSPKKPPEKVAYSVEVITQAQNLQNKVLLFARDERRAALGLDDSKLMALNRALNKILDGKKMSHEEITLYDGVLAHFKKIGFLR